MIDKLFLHVVYECHRRNILIPWDAAVHRLSPHTNSSGFAALQALNKHRDLLVSEGHMVPPLLGKLIIPQPRSVRGHIRDMNASSPIATRVVRWNEAIEDRAHSLVEPDINRGSGNYPRGRHFGTNTIYSRSKPIDGGRRCRLTAEELAAKNDPAPQVPKVRKKPGPKLGSKNKPKAPKVPVPVGSTSVDPVDDPLDESYSPPKKKARGKYKPRQVIEKEIVRGTDPPEYNGSQVLPPTPLILQLSDCVEHNNFRALSPTPSASQHGDFTHKNGRRVQEPHSRSSSYDGFRSAPLATLPITLCLRPELLASFPAGVSKPTFDAASDDSNSDAYEDHPETDEDPEEYNYDDAATSDWELEKSMNCDFPSNYEQPHPAQHQHEPAVVEKILADRTSGGYQGVMVHGTLNEYKAALRSGKDPFLNGLSHKNAALVAREATSSTKSTESFLARDPARSHDQQMSKFDNYTSTQYHSQLQNTSLDGFSEQSAVSFPKKLKSINLG